MDMLLAGVLLWSGVHYIPGLLPNLKIKLVEKLGKGYRGVFSLLIVGSIVLMVFGWKSAIPEVIYDPLPNAVQLTSVLMILTFYLFGAAHGPSNIKRYIRHPMLTAVIVWGEYVKPVAIPMKKDIIKLVIALVIYTVIVFIHPYIAGVPVMAM